MGYLTSVRNNRIPLPGVAKGTQQIRRILDEEDAVAAGAAPPVQGLGSRCHRVGDRCQGGVAHTVTPCPGGVKPILCENRDKPEKNRCSEKIVLSLDVNHV